MVESRKCFIVMPFSGTADYEKGHFDRVYNYLIKPACRKVKFEPIRGDDVANSNYIVIDILRKILDSEMIICDLSSMNPNVLYELGLRQAFNKPSVLIKDNKTESIFDIQGFRYLEYDSSLRIDQMELAVTKLSEFLEETYENRGSEINSIIQMLGIEPAEVKEKIKISEENSVILAAINNLSKKVNGLESFDKKEMHREEPILNYYTDIVFRPIEDLGLSVKIVEILNESGIYDIGSLTKLTEKDFIKIIEGNNESKDFLIEIKMAFAFHKVSFSDG